MLHRLMSSIDLVSDRKEINKTWRRHVHWFAEGHLMLPKAEQAQLWLPSGHSVTSYTVFRVSRDPSWRSWHIKRVTHPSRTN